MAMQIGINIPFGFYYIQRDYIDYIREHGDEHVPKADYEDEGRSQKFYCGPVMNEYGVNYYVPVSHEVANKGTMTVRDGDTEESYGTFILNEKSKKIGNLDFRFMIPCQDNELLTPYNPTKFGLQQLEFCQESKSEICTTAKFAYNNIRSGDYPFLTESAIDFDKVNDAMWAYEDEKMNRRLIKANTLVQNIKEPSIDDPNKSL